MWPRPGPSHRPYGNDEDDDDEEEEQDIELDGLAFEGSFIIGRKHVFHLDAVRAAAGLEPINVGAA